MASPRFASTSIALVGSVVLALAACTDGAAEPTHPPTSSRASSESAEAVESTAATEPSVPSDSLEPSAGGQSPEPPVRSTFPVDTFADISDYPVDDDLAATFETILAEAAEDRGTSATILTAEGSWSGAAGEAEDGREVTPNDLFAIASVTKPIIAAQVMLLVEAGTIGLDDPATDHLPPDLALDTNGATIRHLLAMQSGLPDSAAAIHLLTADPTRVWTPAEVLQYVTWTQFPAGEGWLYSNTNYILLGMVIEHATGRPLADVLREGALKDPGLSRIVVQPAEKPTAPLAVPNDLVESRGGFLPTLAVASGVGAAGGFAADSPSVAWWWKLFCGGEIVSRESLTLMAAIPEDIEIEGDWIFETYGLGVFGWRDFLGLGHTGYLLPYRSLAVCAPEFGATVAVLTKNPQVPIEEIADALLTAASAP